MNARPAAVVRHSGMHSPSGTFILHLGRDHVVHLGGPPDTDAAHHDSVAARTVLLCPEIRDSPTARVRPPHGPIEGDVRSTNGCIRDSVHRQPAQSLTRPGMMSHGMECSMLLRWHREFLNARIVPFRVTQHWLYQPWPLEVGWDYPLAVGADHVAP